MKIITPWILLLSTCGVSSCQPLQLLGTWIIKSGYLAGNYDMAAPYVENRVTFSKDTLELASGFFYNTVDPEAEYPLGRYPFAYYGNRERYRIEKDSLCVYSKPYGFWRSFKIKRLNREELWLVGASDTIHLVPNNSLLANQYCEIKYIRAHVHDGDLSLFQLDYKVTFLNNDDLAYEGPDYFNEKTTMHIKLKPGTFKDICTAFSYMDLSHLNTLYTTEFSEFGTIDLEIGMQNGQVFRSEIRNLNCPDKLRLALVPVLYTHQRYAYPNLKPVR